MESGLYRIQPLSDRRFTKEVMIASFIQQNKTPLYLSKLHLYVHPPTPIPITGVLVRFVPVTEMSGCPAQKYCVYFCLRRKTVTGVDEKANILMQSSTASSGHICFQSSLWMDADRLLRRISNCTNLILATAAPVNLSVGNIFNDSFACAA